MKLTLLPVCCILAWDEWLKSYLVSAGAGAAGTLLLFALQVPLGRISSTIERKYPKYKILEIIYEDCVYIIVLVTMLLLWRGCFNLNSTYIFVDPLLGGAVNMAAGLFVLICLRVLNTVAMCDWGLDGNDVGGDAFFPTWYMYLYIGSYKFNKDATP